MCVLTKERPELIAKITYFIAIYSIIPPLSLKEKTVQPLNFPIKNAKIMSIDERL